MERERERETGERLEAAQINDINRNEGSKQSAIVISVQASGVALARAWPERVWPERVWPERV